MRLQAVATISRILFDVMQTVSKNEKVFEIGCKCKTPETQEELFYILSLIFNNNGNDINVIKKDDEDSFIVAVVKATTEEKTE